MGGAYELAGGTPWAEPLSTWTSLAFVLAGAAIVHGALRREARATRSPRLALGVLVALVGIGSVVQHGPSPSWNAVVHDPPLLGVLALVTADALADLTGRRLRTWWWLVPALADVVLAAAGGPASTLAQALAAAVAVVAGAVRAWRRPAVRRRTVVALALLGVGSAVGTQSRPGWPLCDADGPLGVTVQGHAAWHVLAAVALWVLAPTLGTRRPTVQPDVRPDVRPDAAAPTPR
ncbi:hypothetical protein [Cellulosimicrobium sp. CUA-896]|uniref:hypothetical protein n=1 Tax=Cellulosimicrobium sp. CUA-896 TaxID=1517881 RepID=UPI00095E8F8F|nr:hypothetical protein [Cellulosimicrobium sp. CUA-896]OLT48618.1 hypothetical protein BJF88_16740 [Cellulosimicrobium sp. CUA-896]